MAVVKCGRKFVWYEHGYGYGFQSLYFFMRYIPTTVLLISFFNYDYDSGGESDDNAF